MDFAYVAYGPNGKQVKSTIEAPSEEAAARTLKGKGYTIVSLEKAGALNKNISFSIGGKPTPRDMSVFCRQFCAIVDAGVPVVQALGMLAEQTENKMLAGAIAGCKDSIEKGSSLADSMKNYPKVFSNLFVMLVDAGEASGSLTKSFDRMGSQFEKTHALRNMIKKVSIYPVVLLVVTFVVAIVMLVKVVPMFKDMLEELGTELPGITKFMLGLSNWMQQYWWLLIIIIVGVIVVIKLLQSNEATKRGLDTLRLKIPKFNTLAIKTASASFARTLSTLLGSGIPMIEAIGITANTMDNLCFKDALNEAKNSVSMGSNLSTPIKATKRFPPLVHHMISVGEDTGNIDGMLDRLADYYEEEVKEATEQVMALLEPLVIILLAGVVGSIVLSIMMPMASMMGGMENL